MCVHGASLGFLSGVVSTTDAGCRPSVEPAGHTRQWVGCGKTRKKTVTVFSFFLPACDYVKFGGGGD